MELQTLTSKSHVKSHTKFLQDKFFSSLLLPLTDLLQPPSNRSSRPCVSTNPSHDPRQWLSRTGDLIVLLHRKNFCRKKSILQTADFFGSTFATPPHIPSSPTALHSILWPSSALDPYMCWAWVQVPKPSPAWSSWGTTFLSLWDSFIRELKNPFASKDERGYLVEWSNSILYFNSVLLNITGFYSLN